MNKIKKIIMSLIVGIIIMITMLLILLLRNRNTLSENNMDNNLIENVSNNDLIELKSVEDENKFYTVRDCIKKYLDFTNTKNSFYYGYNQERKYTKVTDQKQINEHIYNLLGTRFIEKNNINLSNLHEKIDIIDQNVIFTPLYMKFFKNQDIEEYAVYGIIEDVNCNYIKDINMIVNLDIKNNTFSIEPVKNATMDLSKVELNNEKYEIVENSDNKFKIKTIDEEDIIKEYFDSYKKIILGKPELSYQYLDEEYRNKRFSNINKYKEFSDKNINTIKSANISKYAITKYDNFVEYACVDQYENYYIFKVKNVMDYTLKLDTYTILSDKFKSEYNSGNVQKRVQLNIDKFVKMINSKDYNNLYNLLDEEFRNNKFKSVDNFEKFIKNNFYEYNKVTFNKFSNEGEIYIYEITLKNKLDKNDTSEKNVNIIMKLLDNYNFVMSFGSTT